MHIKGLMTTKGILGFNIILLFFLSQVNADM